jgi:hypothetical protein
VAQRVPEIGLRMALGAERASVRWMILRQSLAVAIVGLAAGAGRRALPARASSRRCCISCRRGIRSRSPSRPRSCSRRASWPVTCRRGVASRVDPLVALRAE